MTDDEAGVWAIITTLAFFPIGIFWVGYFLIRAIEDYKKEKSGK